MKDNRRIKCILIRLTSAEYESIKDASVNFNSISQYIRAAIKEYSNKNIKTRFEAIETLTAHYLKYHNVLFHTAGNLNQTVKRANELNHVGLLTSEYLKENIMPKVTELSNVIVDIRNMLDTIMKEIIKQ